MLSRREFLAGTAATLSVAAGAAASSARRDDEVVRALYDRAFVVDTTTIGGPAFDVDAAIAAGLTATVADLPIYPRNFPNAVAAMADWNAAFNQPGTRLVKVLRAADIDTAKREKRFGIILACQDASILDASTYSVNDYNLRNLELFYALGLRVLQMTHNERNSVGEGFREKRDGGLSRLGEAVVDRMNALGMLVDVAHCSDLTTMDAIERSKRPCVISHSACRALFDSRRNKTDAQIRALAQRGGVFGVFNMTHWMTDRPTASVDTVVDHIDHAVKIAGVAHVAFGNDQPILQNDTPYASYLAGMQAYAKRNLGLPGAERVPEHVMAQELNHPQRLLRLAAALDRRGYKTSAIEGIIGGNFVRVFKDVCG
jgi:membrane dipeptidase